MKKLLLSLVSLLLVSMSAAALEKQFVVDATNSTFGGTGTAHGSFNYTNATSEISLSGWANKSNNAIGLAKQGGYIALTANPHSFRINKVVVTAQTGSSKTTTLQGKVSNEPYTYIASLSQTWTGTNPATPDNTSDNGSYNMLQNTEDHYTFNINDYSFVIYNSTNAGAISISQLTVYYEELPLPEMSFPEGVVHGKVGVGVVWHPVTVTVPADESLRGEITYSSSDPEIVSVDPTTGQITKDDVHKAGTVEITATMAAKGGYSQGSASYTIVIVDQNVSYEASTQVFDFTIANPYGMATQEGTSSKMETAVKKILSADDMVTLSFSGNYRSWKTNNAYELRMQKSSSFTVEVPDGCKITKIGLVATGGSSSNINGSYTPAGKTGLTGDNGEDEWEVNQSNWMPADDTPINKVTFNTSPSTTTNISKIYVLYEAEGSTLKTPDLSFTKVINNLYVNEPSSLNAVNNPNNKEITYSIENLADDQYTITPSADGKTIEVLVKTPGYYTLKATSPADDEYRDGFAIMRINVYRHLDVYVNGLPFTGDDELNTKAENVITMDVPAFTKLYYQIVSESAETTAVPFATDDDEDLVPGYTLYNGGITIPANTTGSLNFYIANYGYQSPIRTIKLDPTASLDNITITDEDVEPIYYNLQGIRVNNPENGQLYIRKQGSKVSKVIL